MGWGQGHRLRCRMLKKVGCLFLMDGQEKRNREETHFEVEGREMERVHIKCLTISAQWEPRLSTCGRVERAGGWLAA